MGNISYDLKNRVFVITGGSRGIGLEIAQLLLDQKAKVIICGRKQEGLEAAKTKLSGGAGLLTVQHILQKNPMLKTSLIKLLKILERSMA